MQVVGINSSPRKKSSTDLLLMAVLQGAEDGGCDTEHINLYDFEIEFCTACESCYKTGECSLMDEFPDVYEVILASEGIVLASPNYINNVSAKMKVMLDRMADTVHCQRFLHKYSAAVSTAGGSGSRDVAEYLNRSLFGMGASVVGAIGIDLAEGEAAFQNALFASRELGIRLADAIITHQAFPEQEQEHALMLERMKQLVVSRKDDWTNEYEYFQKKKWL